MFYNPSFLKYVMIDLLAIVSIWASVENINHETNNKCSKCSPIPSTHSSVLRFMEFGTLFDNSTKCRTISNACMTHGVYLEHLLYVSKLMKFSTLSHKLTCRTDVSLLTSETCCSLFWSEESITKICKIMFETHSTFSGF